MNPLCACGCGSTTSIIRDRSNDVKRGIIAGAYRKYASHECYLKDRRSNRSSLCAWGHVKDKPHPKGMRCRRCEHAHRISRKYDVDFEEVLEHPPPSNGACELCGIVPTGNPWDVLNWDHNHGTGAFRGWLCGLCNRGLGMFEDNAELMKAAAKYVEERR